MTGSRVFICLCLVAAGAAPTPAAEDSLAIGSRLEPLVDDYLIEKMEGAALVLHSPVPQELAIVHDAPWEGNTCCYHTVFQDGERFRMYYRGSHFRETARHKAHPETVCYAESTDGVHWTKPELGLFEYDGSKANNIVWAGEHAHNFAPFKDSNPDAASDARYKAFVSGKGGLLPLKSADGIHWALMSDQPVITDGAFDSQNLAFWDRLRGCYVDFHRDFRDGVRDIKTCTSRDFLHWTAPVWLDYGGAPPEHLYTNQVAPYHRAPHIYLGFPKRFVPERNPTGHPHTGVSDGVFMTSRDGVHFHRWGEAFLRPGLQPERWVNRNNMTAWGILETESSMAGAPKELSLYSTEGYYAGEAARLRRFTIRIDGFVSVQAPCAGGRFTTKALVFGPPTSGVEKPKRPRVPGPVVWENEKPLIGRQSLRFGEPAILTLPGTRDLGKQVTMAVHIRDVPSGFRRLFSAYNGSTTKPRELCFDVGLDTMAIRFLYDDLTIGAPPEKALGLFDLNLTHHVAATWDDGVVKLYYDGKEVASGGKAGRGDLGFALGDLHFGEDYPPTSTSNEPFLGMADDILVLRRVLSAEEVAAVAARGAAAVVDPAREDGGLYTMEADGKENTLADCLAGDGQQDVALPGPALPGEVELAINFSTAAAGSIRCEIQDAAGKPIPGYHLDQCDELFGDTLRRSVSWEGRTELKELAGKPIRLHFVLSDADLYSLRFDGATDIPAGSTLSAGGK